MDRNAATTVESGNCSNTAPRVPPNTISAAVGCRSWPMLPPSIRSPAMMPAMARVTPAILDLSIVKILAALLLVGLVLAFFGSDDATGLIGYVETGQRHHSLQIVPGRHSAAHCRQQTRAIVQNALCHFLACVAHNHLFAVDEGKHGVRRSLRGLDEVAVQHNGVSIETRQFDHPCISSRIGYRR